MPAHPPNRYPSPHARLLTRLALVAPLAAMALAGAAPTPAPAPSTLTRAAEVRSLTREEAAKALPVKIKGIVVLQAVKGHGFNLYDGQETVAVHVQKARGRSLFQKPEPRESDSALGSLVEVEGITDPAGYSPVVVPTRIRRFGSAPLPPPLKPNIGDLLSGSLVSQFVEIEGVVQDSRLRSNGNLELLVVVDGHPCDVKVSRPEGLLPEAVIDARVRIQGCSSPIFNVRSEATLMHLLVHDKNFVHILRPPPADPFLSPKLPLRSLLPFSRNPDRFHRKRTGGIVSFTQPGRFYFLLDGNAGVRVNSPPDGISVGDLVDVAGFVDASMHIASLNKAIARRVGSAALPAAANVTPEELLYPAFPTGVERVADNDHHGSIVCLSGTILDNTWNEENKWARLQMAFGDSRFRVFLPLPDKAAAAAWQEGSVIRATGVCELEFGTSDEGPRFPVINGFILWTRGPGDITTLHAPPWWTPWRLGLALATALIVLVLVFLWAWALRRQVARQMAIISGKLRDEAVGDERNRMARDLHDTLEQQLAGVSLQLDCAGEILAEDPAAAKESLTLARRMLSFTRTEARRSVWDLRSHVLENHGLESALHNLADASRSPAGPEINVTFTGDPVALPAATTYNLYHMAQEALANALKHARASLITINASFTPGGIHLSITDDGRGFATGMLDHTDSPHFGITGLRERAAKINAELEISSNPGHGCRVSILVPPPNPPSPSVHASLPHTGPPCR